MGKKKQLPVPSLILVRLCWFPSLFLVTGLYRPRDGRLTTRRAPGGDAS